jgi:hypothetical protein
MTGWKTKTGSFLVALSPFLPLLGVQQNLADIVMNIGMALMGTGIAHKIEKGRL